MPDSCLSQWQFSYSRSKGTGQVICSACSRSLFPAAIFHDDTLVHVKRKPLVIHPALIPPPVPGSLPNYPTGQMNCSHGLYAAHGLQIEETDDYTISITRTITTLKARVVARTESRKAWTPHAPELYDRQCLKIESMASLCSPFPSNSSWQMESCPQLAAPWVGSLSPAAPAGASTASLKGCQGLAGHPPKGRKEGGGREKNWKITTKRTSSFLKLETLKQRFMNLWVYETTWCFGVCCWLNLAVQSLVVVFLH